MITRWRTTEEFGGDDGGGEVCVRNECLPPNEAVKQTSHSNMARRKKAMATGNRHTNSHSPHSITDISACMLVLR